MGKILRGDIIWADLNPVRGNEQAGRRPAIVLSPERYNAAAGLWIASGIVLIGTAVTTAALAPRADRGAAPPVALAPAAGPGGAGLVASGRF